MFDALEHLTVIDITEGPCGAYATQLMRDGGARVIKVEPPRGDYLRLHGLPSVGGVGADFFALNRGKESVTLDLATDGGLAALRRLLANADVFVEDLGPERARELSLDYESLSLKNRGLIQATLTPFGEQGPWRDHPGSELIAQAASDYWSSLGRIGEPPLRVGADIAYINSAIFLYQAVLAAIFQRYSTGNGQRVSVNLMGTLMYTRKTIWTAIYDPDEWAGAHVDNYTNPPSYGYKTKDGFVYFSLRRGNEEQYYGILDAFGILDRVITDSRFEDGGRRAVGMGQSAEEVKRIWEEAFADKTSAEVVEILHGFAAEAMPVNNYEQLIGQEQVKALELIYEIPVPGSGPMNVLSLPWWADGVRHHSEALPPSLGEHTQTVLTAAGLSETEIGALTNAAIG